VVEHHHDATIAPESHFLVATVAMADYYASHLGYNLVKEMPRPAHDNIAAFFGLGDANAVADFLEHCMERFKVLSAVLD
jgi:hypothetical protein